MSRRMRTAGDAVNDLRRDDPETPITRHTIVTWAKMGLIHSVMIGNRRLISMDSLENYLAGICDQKELESEEEPKRGMIRAVVPSDRKQDY